MLLFCSTREFEGLCRDIADKADVLRLQAKGGSMYPFIKSGDWVEVSLFRQGKNSIRKGDIVLFKKDESLYLHRVLRKDKEGFITKGDMSFRDDGAISLEDALARVISIQRGARRIDLCTAANRFIAVLIADSSLIMKYPFLFLRTICSFGMGIFLGIQRIKACRLILKRIFRNEVNIRVAGQEDTEQLRDLYLMSGHDIREGIARIKNEGFWLVAERNHRIAGGFTMARYEKDVALWLIFGLEVKPLFRGLGIGEKLVREAISKAKTSGISKLGLFVNKEAKAALNLYKKLGFKISLDYPSEFNVESDELYLLYEL